MKAKKAKEDYTKRCVCEPKNKIVLERCYDCMVKYDVESAGNIILPARMCDPNYGVQEPIYRETSKPEPTKKSHVAKPEISDVSICSIRPI